MSNEQEGAKFSLGIMSIFFFIVLLAFILIILGMFVGLFYKLVL